MEKVSAKEKRIRQITQLYYSRPDVQKAIYEFSKSREICPRYFEGFGKRPDAFQFKGDVFGLAKKGATSFNCSEELWQNPLEIKTGMDPIQANELRTGWDLIIDIDCKWFDYAKLAAISIVEAFAQHGIKNVGVKFSGSKGFHIILPWKAIPKEIHDEETKNLFPEVPRKLIAYLRNYAGKIMEKKLPDDFFERFGKTDIKKGIKCLSCGELGQKKIRVEAFCKFCNQGYEKLVDFVEELPAEKCPNCKREMEISTKKILYVCERCKISSEFDSARDLEIERANSKFAEVATFDIFDIMGLDLILTSPRHLFRTPYSLHEKTALASVVILPEEIETFDFKKADPMQVEIRDFMPEPTEDEAKEFVMQALDWAKTTRFGEEIEKRATGKYENYKAVKIKDLNDSHFPPSILKILEGVKDGKKRALFILINFFRSVGFEKEEIEKRIFDWNKKNETPLKKGYITAQLSWSYNHKIIPPPNFDKDYYKGIGVLPTTEEMRLKNPVNYVLKMTAPNKNNSQKSHEN